MKKFFAKKISLHMTLSPRLKRVNFFHYFSVFFRKTYKTNWEKIITAVFNFTIFGGFFVKVVGKKKKQ